MAPKFTMSAKKQLPVIKEPKKTKIRHGSDFTGMNTTGLALIDLCSVSKAGCEPVNRFGCDITKASRKFTQFTDPPDMWFNDICTRDQATLDEYGKNLDLYAFAGPCQGFSTAGKGLGAADPRSQLTLKSVAFIEKSQPKSFVMENVHNLLTEQKYEKILKLVCNSLKKAGYTLWMKVLNSTHWVPQSRQRIYMVGIRTDVLRSESAAHGVGIWPELPTRRLITLPSVIDVITSPQWRPHPPKNTGTQYRNVIKAYKAAKGVNPFVTPIVVDYKASERFSSSRVNEMPCLTKTRCGARGYWCSTKGGPVTIDEMALCQGFRNTQFPWREAGLSEHAAGSLLGNGQTLSLVRDLLPRVLLRASVISYDQFVEMSNAKF